MTMTAALIGLALLTMVLLATLIFHTYATQGFGYGFSSNRAQKTEISAFGKRIANTYNNQVETSAFLVPILVVAALLNIQTDGAQFAAMLILIGRAAFAVLYYTGLPFARVPAFGIANVSALYIVYEIISSGAL